MGALGGCFSVLAVLSRVRAFASPFLHLGGVDLALARLAAVASVKRGLVRQLEQEKEEHDAVRASVADATTSAASTDHTDDVVSNTTTSSSSSPPPSTSTTTATTATMTTADALSEAARVEIAGLEVLVNMVYVGDEDALAECAARTSVLETVLRVLAGSAAPRAVLSRALDVASTLVAADTRNALYAVDSAAVDFVSRQVTPRPPTNITTALTTTHPPPPTHIPAHFHRPPTHTPPLDSHDMPDKPGVRS
jgi:cytoskeletal protein RodZ